MRLRIEVEARTAGETLDRVRARNAVIEPLEEDPEGPHVSLDASDEMIRIAVELSRGCPCQRVWRGRDKLWRG